MKKVELQQKLARLESYQDQLETEFTQLDELLKLVGFENGLTTLKAVACQMESETSSNE